ncbi:MAG: glycosyltransferase [Deltaproteobacteria bacterium]|nr:glycosyltransferase [Deltaproteobacteria bacterium]
MNAQRLVSIITATYNHEQYIGECIESVLSQTYPFWEMIIVDDGSTDKTAEVALGYKDRRIQYVRQENHGIYKLAETYNKALRLAKGELVAILEGDDYWPANKLDVQVKDFDNPDVVLSFGKFQVMRDGKPLKILPPESLPEEARVNRPIGRGALYMMDPDYLIFCFPVSVVIRAKTLERIGGFQQPPYLPVTDYPTFLRLMFEGEAAYHNEILGFWRRHHRSSTTQLLPVILDGVQRLVMQTLDEKGSFFTPEEKARTAASWSIIQIKRWALLGRLFLEDGQWANARRSFRNALKLPCAVHWRLALGALTAISYLHLNVEPLARCLGLPTVRDYMAKDDHMISKDMIKGS